MFTYILSAFALYLAYLVFKVIIRPYLTVRKYKKYGFQSEFFPILGYTRALEKGLADHGDALHFMKVASKNKCRGFATNILSTPELMLSDPALIKEFFSKQELYTKPDQMFILLKEFVGEGLIFLDGPKWKSHRKLVSMAFHYELLKDMIADFGLITQEFYEKIKKTKMNEVNIMNEYQAITGEAVGRLFFGEKFSDYSLEGQRLSTYLANVVTKLSYLSLSPSYLIFGKNFVKAGLFREHREILREAEEFKKFCIQIIKNKMKEFDAEAAKGTTGQRKNLLKLFHEQRTSNPQEALSDIEILGEFLTFFVAGMDTTGHLVTFATYYIHKHPEYKARLMEEINQFCPSSENVDLDKLNKMEFMTAFMKECLRMATPAPYPFERVALADHKIGEIPIKAGTLINASYAQNNFDPEYHSQPEKFDPERWLNPESLTMKSVTANPHIFTPFSIGSRNCIGQHMAMNEARVLFSLFLKNFDFEFSDKNFKERMRCVFLYEFEKDLTLDLTDKFVV